MQSRIPDVRFEIRRSHVEIMNQARDPSGKSCGPEFVMARSD